MALLENHVIQTLKDNIFSYHKIPFIMKTIDKYTGDTEIIQRSKTEDIESQLAEITHSKDNILKAVESGIVASHFSIRLDELKAQEEQLRAQLVIANQPQSFHVTEKDVKLLINKFNFMVKEYDVIGLRKLLLDFIQCVTVTNGVIDVSLKISFGDISISDLSE